MLSCIRFGEVLNLQGPPLLGAILAAGPLSSDRIFPLTCLALGNSLLVAHVFSINDWSHLNADRRDTNRLNLPFLATEAGGGALGFLWFGLLAVSLVVFGGLGFPLLLNALAIATLSALYSAPAFDLKGTPIVSSVLHIAGGVLHFLLGYTLFSPIDARGLLVGCFFGIVFAAGHLMHEVRDYQSDLMNGIRTNAVQFGKGRSFAAGLALFAIAGTLLVVLAVRGLLPRPLLLVSVPLNILHLYWSVETWQAGLTFENIQRLQVRYRVLYATIGLALFALALQGRGQTSPWLNYR